MDDWGTPMKAIIKQWLTGDACIELEAMKMIMAGGPTGPDRKAYGAYTLGFFHGVYINGL